MSSLFLISQFQQLSASCYSGLIYPLRPSIVFFLEYPEENVREVVALVNGGGILSNRYF